MYKTQPKEPSAEFLFNVNDPVPKIYQKYVVPLSLEFQLSMIENHTNKSTVRMNNHIKHLPVVNIEFVITLTD